MNKQIIKFQIFYWAMAALLLFLYGLTYGHWEVALIRNLYFPVVGLILSTAMIPLYEQDIFRDPQKQWLLMAFTSGAAAIITAFILNPITFALLGSKLSVLPLKAFSKDTLYFALFYFVWSMLYFGRQKQTGHDKDTPNITVESRGEIRTLNIDDVECVQSSGDYIDLMTPAKNYLKKETLSNFETEMGQDVFKRIHRTTIVNVSHITSVVSKGRGVYEVTLTSGRKVLSSRSYRDEIETILPTA